MTEPDRPQTTTGRGLGAKHRRQRTRLLRALADGTPCWWCDKALHRDPTRNWDQAPLEADHSRARRDHGPHELADRLLHMTCNRQRGAGDHDDQRPAVTGQWPPATPPQPSYRAGFQDVNVTFI